MVNRKVVEAERTVGHWCVSLLGLIIFAAWLKALSSFSESSFSQYLTEFDFAEIARIEYPTTAWESRASRLVAVVGILFGLSLFFETLAHHLH